jgi:hypothetical protein
MAQSVYAVLNEGDRTALAEHKLAISERASVQNLLLVSTIIAALMPVILLLP